MRSLPEIDAYLTQLQGELGQHACDEVRTRVGIMKRLSALEARAAAPDLLAACEELDRLFHNTYSLDGDENAVATTHEPTAVWAAFRAAIRKARGTDDG